MVDFSKMKRDNYGLISLNNLTLDNIRLFRDYNHKTFEYNDRTYYYKRISSLDNMYNELICNELAKDYGIPCVEYELVSFGEQIGLISEEISNLHLLSEYLSDDECNLEDIWMFLESRFSDSELVYKLMSDLVNVFIFDVLIANNDRHIDNLGLIIDGDNISLSPIFDNDNLLNEIALYYGEHALGVDKLNSSISKFIDISDSYYIELIRDKINIISLENIDLCFERISQKIQAPLNDFIAEKLKRKFATNYDLLNAVIIKRMLLK